MKKILPLVLCAALTFGSCDDDDELFYVPNSIEAAFSAKYPNQTVKEWEKDGRYYKAEFHKNGTEAEAWFNANGQWVKTATDFFGDLPTAVSSYLDAHYPGYRVEEIDWVEMPQLNCFKIELEKGDHEIDLYITADGMVIEIGDDDAPHYQIPAAVLNQFAADFPGIVRMEWEKEGPYYKAEFVKDNKECEAWYTAEGKWVKTETDFKGQLPQAVTDYLQATYPGYRIEDTNFVEVPGDRYYEIELEKGDSEWILTIHEDGSLIEVVPDHD